VAATFEMRGYYKPVEGAERIPMIEPLLQEDLARVGVAGGVGGATLAED
jgi:hypothetical protein